MQEFENTLGNRNYFVPDPVSLDNRDFFHLALQRMTSSRTERAICAGFAPQWTISPGLPVPAPETLTFGTAAPGNERFFVHAFKGADVLKPEVVPIALGIKLRTGETAGNPLTAAHRVGIERSRKSCRPARVNIGMDIP